jgi:hypothetical protein
VLDDPPQGCEADTRRCTYESSVTLKKYNSVEGLTRNNGDLVLDALKSAVWDFKTSHANDFGLVLGHRR